MSRKRILIAEDDEGTRTVLGTVLETSQYSVESARDGNEALEAALERAPDLLLTDVMMPRVDGRTLVKRLRSRVDFALMPVIFLTKLDSQGDRIYGFRLGADAYVAKLFDYEELVARVGRALDRRAAMEDEIRNSLTRRGTPVGSVGADEEALIQGPLAHLGVSSLLLVFEQQRTTGVFEAHHPEGHRARIRIRDGHVVQASLDADGEMEGAEAVYDLLAWREGHFALWWTIRTRWGCPPRTSSWGAPVGWTSGGPVTGREGRPLFPRRSSRPPP